MRLDRSTESIGETFERGSNAPSRIRHLAAAVTMGIGSLLQTSNTQAQQEPAPPRLQGIIQKLVEERRIPMVKIDPAPVPGFLDVPFDLLPVPEIHWRDRDEWRDDLGVESVFPRQNFQYTRDEMRGTAETDAEERMAAHERLGEIADLTDERERECAMKDHRPPLNIAPADYCYAALRRHEHPYVHALAIDVARQAWEESLGHLTPAHECRLLILEALKSNHPNVSLSAVKFMMDPYVYHLNTKDPIFQQALIRALDAFLDTTTVSSEKQEELLHGRATEIRECITLLERNDYDLHAALPSLTRALHMSVFCHDAATVLTRNGIGIAEVKEAALREASPRVRQAALSALWQTACTDIEVTDVFLAALHDTDALVRMTAAAGLLSRSSEYADTALPIVASGFATSGSTLAFARRYFQKHIGNEDTALVPILTKLLQSDDYQMRLHAMVALGRIGPGAKPALPQLLREARKFRDTAPVDWYTCHDAIQAAHLIATDDNALQAELNELEKLGRERLRRARQATARE